MGLKSRLREKRLAKKVSKNLKSQRHQRKRKERRNGYFKEK